MLLFSSVRHWIHYCNIGVFRHEIYYKKPREQLKDILALSIPRQNYVFSP